MTGREWKPNIDSEYFKEESDVINVAFPVLFPLEKRNYITDHHNDYYKGWIYFFSEETNWCRSDDSKYPVDCYAYFVDGECRNLSIVEGFEGWEYGSPPTMKYMPEPMSYVVMKDMDPTLAKLHLLVAEYERTYTDKGRIL